MQQRSRIEWDIHNNDGRENDKENQAHVFWMHGARANQQMDLINKMKNIKFCVNARCWLLLSLSSLSLFLFPVRAPVYLKMKRAAGFVLFE